jgi:hypothetical protein
VATGAPGGSSDVEHAVPPVTLGRKQQPKQANTMIKYNKPTAKQTKTSQACGRALAMLREWQANKAPNETIEQFYGYAPRK